MKKIIWKNLSDSDKNQLLKRPANLVVSKPFQRQVKKIIEDVKARGDLAILDYTEKYDGTNLKEIKVSEIDLESAAQKISSSTYEAIRFAIKNIENYHKTQIPNTLSTTTEEGVICERQARAIQNVGLYVPGGSAPLISTVMMLAIPAQIAGCPLRILCTPPNRNGEINPILLATAWMCGITNVYKAGGAQAIAAMAYGTETIPKTHKIFGPGNSWVTQAKLNVSKDPEGAAIDLPAGPSELMIIADETANPNYVAADLLSQAEHGNDSQVFLVSTCEQTIISSLEALSLEAKQLPRYPIIENALKNGAAILVDNIEEALLISNLYAPEHLSLQVKDPNWCVQNIHAAGAVFVGHFAPETAGDYVTGANHVLPTYGYAKNHSGLSVTDFMKFISIQYVTKKGLSKIALYAETLAELEGLSAHKHAISVRL